MVGGFLCTFTEVSGNSHDSGESSPPPFGVCGSEQFEVIVGE